MKVVKLNERMVGNRAIEFKVYGFISSPNETVFLFERLLKQKYDVYFPLFAIQKLELFTKLFFVSILSQTYGCIRLLY